MISTPPARSSWREWQRLTLRRSQKHHRYFGDGFPDLHCAFSLQTSRQQPSRSVSQAATRVHQSLAAAVVRGQVFDNGLCVAGADRRPISLDHLIDFVFPALAIEKSRIDP